MDIGISIVVTFVLVLVNGYFSMSEMALVNAKHVLLRRRPTKATRAPLGRSASRRIPASSWPPSRWPSRSWASSPRPRRPPTCPTLWRSGCRVSASTGCRRRPRLSPRCSSRWCVSYLSIVVGELVPKRMALADPERVSKTVAGPLRVFQKIASPLVCLHVGLGQRSGPPAGHQELRREPGCLGRGDQAHGGRQRRAAGRREAHDPRDHRHGRHVGARGHAAARRHDPGGRRGNRAHGHRAHARHRLFPPARVPRGLRPHRGHRPLQGPHRAAHGRPRGRAGGQVRLRSHVRARDEGHLPPVVRNANESSTDGHRGGRVRGNRWFNNHRGHRGRDRRGDHRRIGRGEQVPDPGGRRSVAGRRPPAGGRRG